MTTPRVARDLVVHGQVQAVGYRFSCQAEARERGVTGWVRNRGDGTVHAHLEGAPDAVDAVVAWAHQGPSHARVSGVEVTEVDPDGCTGFEVR